MPALQKDLSGLIGERIGKYRIQRELARGGMGVVFEVVHEEIGHRAAAKLLSAELARDPKHQDYVDRFFGEAKAVNIVQHPGLVQIFDFGQLRDGTVYILMEYLDGESLGERLRRIGGRAIGVAEALRITRRVAAALTAAHDKGIVHRDLKPENVFVVVDPAAPGDERTKVLDFGIAKFLDSPQRMTTAGVVLGTSLYMSPEQCQGTDHVTDRSDVYSLGVMLYEMLAGDPPFSGGNSQVLRLHLFSPPPPLQTKNAGLPQAVYHLVDQMLAKDSAARPAMAEVALRIRQIEVAGELPAAAEPPASAVAPTRALNSIVTQQPTRISQPAPRVVAWKRGPVLWAALGGLFAGAGIGFVLGRLLG